MITVKAHTICGESNPIYLYYLAVDTANYDWGYSYSVFPNPVNNELTISYDIGKKEPISHYKSTIADAPITINLYNEKGKMLREGKIQLINKTLTINTQDIPAGTYYLQIVRSGEKPIRKQIIIKH